MHELSIMQSALSVALDQARQAGASRVHVIRLRIGALSGVVPDALEFAFEALAPGTPAEGAELAIDMCRRGSGAKRAPGNFSRTICSPNAPTATA